MFQHQYREPGIYYPVLVATDINGCTDFSIVDTIIAHQAQIDIRPRDSLICGTEGDFYFNDSSRSSEIVQSIRFNIKSFGYDSTFDHIPIPFHTDQSGKYSIHYYLNNEYCSDSAQYDHLFQLSKRPAAIYQINQSEFCAGDTIQLINQSLSREVPIASFHWKDNLIDIHTDTLSNILDQGLHTYLLIAKTIAGCEDTARLDLDVKPAVFSTLSQDTIVCAGTLVTLKSIINNPVEGMSYKWSNGPTTLCLDCLEYTFRSESGSNYQFMTTHPNGCVRSFSEQIKTRPNPIQNIQLTNDTSICRNVPLPLAVKVLNDVYAYTWDSTRAGLSCYTYCNNPIALPTDHTTYLVTIRDGTGCERLDSVRVRVKNSIPIDLGADRTICKNDSLQVNVLNITQPRWTGSSGISCTNCSNPFLRPIGSAKYILNALRSRPWSAKTWA